MPTRRLVRFHGQVQGVGFRYTAREIAAGFAVTGTVRNCPDGTVELVAEGEARELKAFLQALQERMGRFIREVNVQAAPATDEFTSFSIRF